MCEIAQKRSVCAIANPELQRFLACRPGSVVFSP
jgi:hypothetical protein